MLGYKQLYSYQIRRLYSEGSGHLFKNTIDASGPNSIISISKTPNEGFKLSSGLIVTQHMVIHPQFVLKWDIDTKKLNLGSYIAEIFSLSRLIDPVPEMVIFGTGNKTVRLRNPDLESFFVSHNIPFESMSTISACSTYNLLVGDARPNILAFILLSNTDIESYQHSI